MTAVARAGVRVGAAGGLVGAAFVGVAATTTTAVGRAVDTAAGAVVLVGTTAGAVGTSSTSAVGAAVGTGRGSRHTGGIGRADARGTVGRLALSG